MKSLNKIPRLQFLQSIPLVDTGPRLIGVGVHGRARRFSYRFGIAALLCGLIASCSNNNQSSGPALGQDQQVFEQFELHGGQATLSWQLPPSGGTLVSGANYFYADSTGGLALSPLSAGPQLETPTLVSLDELLSLPSGKPSRVLLSGLLWLVPPTAKRRVSYPDGTIQVDDLAPDGQTVLLSQEYFGLSIVSLSGMMSNLPEELSAQYPVNDWIDLDNFQNNAQWLTGSAYMKKSVRRLGDTVFAVDCGNSASASADNAATPNPCTVGTTLDNFFPFVLGIGDHPTEADFSTDGTIGTVQGLRMWVANAPLPSESAPTQEFRVFFELGGSVYQGFLQKDGAQLQNYQTDGSAVNYLITLNQQAVSSVQRGLITGTSAPGALAGNPNEVPWIDLFGIGGHGVNGALSPTDLRSHYNIPASLTGAGETIAIVNAPGSGDFLGDLNTFSQLYGLPQCNTTNPCFQRIDLSDGAQPARASDVGGEVALDLAVAHSIAPNATIILVTSKTYSYADLVNAVNVAAKLPGVTAVSLSYTIGGSDTDHATEDSTLAELQSSLGVIFFACTGDDGSVLGARYPAESPYVTGVGGTRINSVPWGSSTTTEVAWEFSGGGVNLSAPMPTWQAAVLPTATITLNSGMRAVPDVAANADPQHSAFAVYRNNHWGMSGGTSEATPLWAGISALLGEYLGMKGESLSALVAATPGGFNGLLYQMKITQSAQGGFYDIVSGSNSLTAAPCDLCTVGPGYDDVTGLGAPDVVRLFSFF